jgi:hypothetical protein
LSAFSAIKLVVKFHDSNASQFAKYLISAQPAPSRRLTVTGEVPIIFDAASRDA